MPAPGYSAYVAPDKYAQLGRVVFGGRKPEESRARLFQGVEDAARPVGMPRTLEARGVAEQEFLAALPDLADDRVPRPEQPHEPADAAGGRAHRPAEEGLLRLTAQRLTARPRASRSGPLPAAPRSVLLRPDLLTGGSGCRRVRWRTAVRRRRPAHRWERRRRVRGRPGVCCLRPAHRWERRPVVRGCAGGWALPQGSLTCGRDPATSRLSVEPNLTDRRHRIRRWPLPERGFLSDLGESVTLARVQRAGAGGTPRLQR